jgi:ABC-type dipeptide/oligopeptide/nickel transport system ATPase component
MKKQHIGLIGLAGSRKDTAALALMQITRERDETRNELETARQRAEAFLRTLGKCEEAE